MPIRLQALGFPNVRDEESLAETLGLIAEKSTQAGPRTLVYRPFDGCAIRIQLDRDHEPESVSAALDSPIQPLIVLERSGRGDAARLSGFSCVDGRAAVPIAACLDCEPEEELEGRMAFVELSAFAEEMEATATHPRDAGVLAVDTRGWLQIEGVLLRADRRTNRITGREVTVGAVWVPGLEIPFALARTCPDLVPGSVVSSDFALFSRVSRVV